MNSKLTKTIVVTGANKGIGYGIVKGLLKSGKSQDARIILTSRNVDLGKKTFNELREKCSVYNVEERLVYQQLDINDTKSQEEFCTWLAKTYGTITTLVNNAGVSINSDQFDTEVFDITFSTNFFETVNFTERVLKANLVTEKIIFVSSSITRWVELAKSKKDQFENPNITSEEIIQLANDFRRAIETKTWKESGWPESCYGMSKVCLSFYTRYLAKRKDVVDRNIQVYSCCPGWVQTDMGGKNASRTLDEGVVCPIFLVELEGNKISQELQGNFFYDSQVVSIFQ